MYLVLYNASLVSNNGGSFEFWGGRKGKRGGAHRGSLILDGTPGEHVVEDFAANMRVDTCDRLMSDVVALESGPWSRMCWACCQRAVTFNHCWGRVSVVALILANHVVPRCSLKVGPPYYHFQPTKVIHAAITWEKLLGNN